MLARFKRFRAQVFHDIGGCFVTGGNGLDDKSRAGGGVSGGKDALSAGGKGVGIGGHGSLRGDANVAVFRNERQARSLPDGKDDQVAGQYVFAVGDSFQGQ